MVGVVLCWSIYIIIYPVCRKLHQSLVSAGKTPDIHPELTLEQIQNPPDTRRGVLRSIGSR